MVQGIYTFFFIESVGLTLPVKSINFCPLHLAKKKIKFSRMDRVYLNICFQFFPQMLN